MTTHLNNSHHTKISEYFPFIALDILSLRNVTSKLMDLERTQWLPPESLEKIQFERLHRLLVHAEATCPYYREMFRSLGIRAVDIRRVEDLAQLPVLTKEIVRERLNDLISEKSNPRLLIKSATGGSTGVPMPFYYSRKHYSWRVAAANRLYRMAGRRAFTRTLYLAGTSIDYEPYRTLVQRVKSRVRREARVPAFDLTEEGTEKLLHWTANYRPEVLMGYASAVELIARAALDHSINIHIPRIITFAEVLTDTCREMLQKIFHAQVFNLYGSREITGIAGECESHNGMHISADIMAMEILENGHPAPSGKPGEIVLTDLMNYDMPLIRYAIGDIGTVLPGVCSCGRGLPRIAISHGRVSDAIRLPEGKTLTQMFFPHLFKEVWRQVREYQIVQTAIDRIVVSIVPTPEWEEETRNYLLDRMSEKLGSGVTVEWQLVDAIPREPSGKYRAVKGLKTPSK